MFAYPKILKNKVISTDQPPTLSSPIQNDKLSEELSEQ